jgi:hypothetical protein
MSMSGPTESEKGKLRRMSDDNITALLETLAIPFLTAEAGVTDGKKVKLISESANAESLGESGSVNPRYRTGAQR